MPIQLGRRAAAGASLVSTRRKRDRNRVAFQPIGLEGLEQRLVLAAPTVLAVSAAIGTYGGTATITAKLSSNGTPVAGESIDLRLGNTDFGPVVTDLSGDATIPAASLAGFNAGNYINAVTASFSGDVNFDPSSGRNDLTVNTASLTITANDQAKVYGSALPILTASFTGLVNGDTPTSLTTLPKITTTATAASHVAGNPYAITASGAVAPNYSISYISGFLSVTAAPLTITVNDQAKVYGSALPILTASFTGLVNGDTPTSLATLPTLATTATAASHVADGPFAITASGAVDSDYAISYIDGALNITAAPLTITADDQSNVYGAALPTLTASYTGFVNGDNSTSLTTQPTITTTATAASHVADGPFAITASGAVDTDYAISYIDGALNITAAPLTITADDQAKVYGAAVPTLTASYAGFVNGDTTASLATMPTITTAATAASHVADGPFAITASGAVDSDYTIGYVDGALSVTAAPLTITADDQAKVYGSALPILTASFTGLVNGDTSASLATLPTLATTATAASHVAGGPYAITASGAVDSDYAIGYVDGALSVTAAPLVISANNQAKVYGAALPTLTASYNGFVNGDTSASLATLPTLATMATAASHVAGNPYAITASGAVDSDYSIGYVDGALSVTPAPLTITANDQTKVSGAALPTLTASFTGLVNGDTSASLATLPTVTTTATASSLAGNYPITATGAADPDYRLSYVDGVLIVTPAQKPKAAVVNDYDGDGKSDVAIYLASSGSFDIRYSNGSHEQVIPFGIAGEGASIPAPGDYDGDGKADLAVYIPSQATLYYRPSSGGPDVANYFGVNGPGQTIPAPGDYFGTGKTNVAVYVAAYGSFAIIDPATGDTAVVPFGEAGIGATIPAPGDYDGDGVTDIAAYLPRFGVYAFRPSSGGPDRITSFGIAGFGETIPTPGDYDGDGKTDLAVYIPSQATLYYRPSSGGPDVANYFGVKGPGQTLPAPGDYLGNGRTQVAGYLPAYGGFAIRPGDGQPDSTFNFGTAGVGNTIPVTVVDEALIQLTTTEVDRQRLSRFLGRA